MKKHFLSLSLVTSVSLIGTAIFTGCTDDSDDESTSEATVKNLSVPTTDTDKQTVLTANSITLNGTKYDVSFKTVIETGDVLNDEVFGLIKDQNGNAITLEDGKNFVCRNSVNGSGLDHTSILTYGDSTFMLTQFECGIGAMYLTEVEQDETTGELTAKSLKYIDQSSEFGGWVHCAGMKTPWGSHLASEEYEPDAKSQVDENGSLSGSYYGDLLTLYWADNSYPNAYYYGWTPEFTLTDADGNYKYTKHYSMGRYG